MRTLVSILSVSALLLATPLVARSDDAPASPADRGQAILSSLPAPSEKDAFKVDLDFFAGGQVIGKATFQAAVGDVDGAPAWRVEESMEIGADAKKMTNDAASTLAADLHLLRFEQKETEAGATTTTLAVRTETGFDVTKTDPAGKKDSKVAADAHTIATFPALLIFLKHCPADPAVYELHGYGDKKGVVERGTLDVKGPGKYTEGETSVDAWVIHAVLGEHTMDIFLDPTDKSLIALRAAEGFSLVKSGLVKPVAGKEMDATKPAASALDAGSRLALAILTSDEALLANSIHWPSLMAVAKATEGFDGDEAAYKKKTMAEFKTTFKTLDRAAASAIVMKAAGGAKEEIVGEATVVTFGAPMETLVFTTKAIDGVWFIVKLSK